MYCRSCEARQRQGRPLSKPSAQDHEEAKHLIAALEDGDLSRVKPRALQSEDIYAVRKRLVSK